MYLYTINGIYPDKQFHFTLSNMNMGLAPEEHTHTINNISQLSSSLNNKASINHTHNYVTGLTGEEVEAPTAITLTTSTTTDTSNNATISLTNQTITINYVSPETGIVTGFKEMNPNNGKALIQFYSGNDVQVEEETFINLSLQENIYD